jgi:hypothetical protein
MASADNKNGGLLSVATKGTGWQRVGSLAWRDYDASGQPTSISGRLPGVPVWSLAVPVVHSAGRFTIHY